MSVSVDHITLLVDQHKRFYASFGSSTFRTFSILKVPKYQVQIPVIIHIPRLHHKPFLIRHFQVVHRKLHILSIFKIEERTSFAQFGKKAIMAMS